MPGGGPDDEAARRVFALVGQGADPAGSDGAVPFLGGPEVQTPLAEPASGPLSLPLGELLWGAITVGATPISIGGAPRPLIELCWRAALAAASLEEDSSGRWVMTDGYWRLDPSEKRAVSYFLGMTQAKIMCGRLLRAPHLIHLDAFLAMIGQTTRTSRPDLVGLSSPAMDVTIAVEAKGRTGGRDDEVNPQGQGAGKVPAGRAVHELRSPRCLGRIL